jgi:nucleoside-diphosphate-sugar epimerase
MGAFRQLGLADRIGVERASLFDADGLTSLFSRVAAECVFHVAGQSQVSAAARNPEEAFDSNVRATWVVLDAARRATPRPTVMLASSDAVYGDVGDRLMTEEMPLAGKAPYAISKICAERIAHSYGETMGLRIGIARCTSVYGGGDRNERRLVPSIIAAVLAGRRPVVRSRGLALRDYLYVEDLADGYLALASAVEHAPASPLVVNLASEQLATVLDVVDRILAIAGRADLAPEIGSEADDPPVKRACPHRAHREIGWRARTPLPEGLTRAFEWSRATSSMEVGLP